MKYSIITGTENISKNEWGKFVFNNSKGNIFQTPEMYDVYKNTKNYYPEFIYIIDNSGKILGLLLTVIQKMWYSPLNILTSRAVTWGGPIIDENIENSQRYTIMNLILDKINKYMKRRALYMEFRNLWDTRKYEYAIFNKNNFIWEDHLDVIIDLTKGKEELWENMKRDRRRGVKKAEMVGLQFEEYPFNKSLNDFYAPLKMKYKEIGIPLVDISFFYASKKFLVPSQMAKFFYVHKNGILLASQLALTYKGTIYALYGAAHKEGEKKYANVYSAWKIIEWGVDNNYKTFDFGGAGRPDKPYGPRDFKIRFGGNIVNYGRYKNIYKPTLLRFAEIGLRLYQNKRRVFYGK